MEEVHDFAYYAVKLSKIRYRKTYYKLLAEFSVDDRIPLSDIFYIEGLFQIWPLHFYKD